MSHSESDSHDPASDPQLQSLGQTLDVLAPIRRHRLTLAEQAWRRHRQVLEALRQRLDSLHAGLQRLQHEFRQSRQEQREQHANRPLPLSEMNDWLAAERQAIRQIEEHQRRVNNLQDEHRQQQQWTEDSHQELRRRQRDVEKLDYLLDMTRKAS